jgi:hypothetical protein
MTWFNVVGLVSTIALLLPITLILILRLAWYKSFPALLAYYGALFVYNCVALEFLKVDPLFVRYFGIGNNFLDAPLMLGFMTYFSKTVAIRRKLQFIITLYVSFEIAVIAFFGFNTQAATIILAPGLLLVIILSAITFLHQAKLTIVHQKAAGKAFIVASLLFAYGGYAFIYVVYYILRTQYKADTYLVYFFINFFSCILISTGIYMERKRVTQLNEVRVTREELKVIYGRSSTKTATS